jgi:hypothetical protein
MLLFPIVSCLPIPKTTPIPGDKLIMVAMNCASQAPELASNLSAKDECVHKKLSLFGPSGLDKSFAKMVCAYNECVGKKLGNSDKLWKSDKLRKSDRDRAIQIIQVEMAFDQSLTLCGLEKELKKECVKGNLQSILNFPKFERPAPTPMPVTKLDPDQIYLEDRKDYFDVIRKCAEATFATENPTAEHPNTVGFKECLENGENGDIFRWRFTTNDSMPRIPLGKTYMGYLLEAYTIFVKDSRTPPEKGTPVSRLMFYSSYSYCTGWKAPSPNADLFNDFNK